MLGLKLNHVSERGPGDMPYVWLPIVSILDWIIRAGKLPWIFPGALLEVNGAPGNIQGNLDSYGL